MNIFNRELQNRYEQAQVAIAEAELEARRIANERAQAELDLFRRQHRTPQRPTVDTTQTTGVDINRNWSAVAESSRTPPGTRPTDPTLNTPRQAATNPSDGRIYSTVGNRTLTGVDIDWDRFASQTWFAPTDAAVGDAWGRTEIDNQFRT